MLCNLLKMSCAVGMFLSTEGHFFEAYASSKEEKEEVYLPLSKPGTSYAEQSEEYKRAFDLYERERTKKEWKIGLDLFNKAKKEEKEPSKKIDLLTQAKEILSSVADKIRYRAVYHSLGEIYSELAVQKGCLNNTYCAEDIIKDQRTALKHFTVAADDNHSGAAKFLAHLYSVGIKDLVEQNLVTSVKYLTLAANQGDSEAQYELATLYDYGIEEVSQSSSKALEYYIFAGARNHEKALAIFLKDDVLKTRFNNFVGHKHLVEKGVPLVTACLILAADLGDAESQYNLASRYEFGVGGVTKSLFEAFHYYTLASNQGYSKAQYVLKKHEDHLGKE